MRVVLDSNVLVRAVASPHGPAGELFERLCAQHVLISSPEMVVELAKVLDYQRIRRLHGLSDEQIAEFIDTIETGALLARCPASLPRVVPDDPDDDAVVATAIAGAADVICSRNRHLFHDSVLKYCQKHAVRVLDDLTLLAELRAREQS